MLDMFSWPVITGIAVGLVFIIYVWGAIHAAGKLITSRYNNDAFVKADQYYYLPAANVDVTVTISYSVTTQPSDSSLVDAQIFQVDMTTNVHILADDRDLFAMKYYNSIFANDEIRLVTNTTGLLENLAVTAEDRIATVLTQIAQAPQQVITAKALPLSLTESPAPGPFTVKNATATRNFTLYADDLLKPEVVKEWSVSIEGTSDKNPNPLDASLRFTFGGAKTRHSLTDKEKKEEFEGILTRPLRNLSISVNLPQHKKPAETDRARRFKTDADLRCEVAVPDTSKLILVPVCRSPFIKKNQVPKLSSGLLVENYINKPSEAEAFLSIPINVAKALFAIPAQLLSFKITHLQQQTSLETETQKLLAAQALAEKAKQDKDKEKDKIKDKPKT